MICDKKEYVVIKPPNIRGKFKILLLYYLDKQPLHGYALIKSITKDFGMNYIPSPGIIYPALQELEKGGYVKKDTSGRRVVYHITPKGKKLLKENIDMINFVFEHMKVYRTFTEELNMKKLLDVFVLLGVWYDKLDARDQIRLKDELSRLTNLIEEMVSKARRPQEIPKK